MGFLEDTVTLHHKNDLDLAAAIMKLIGITLNFSMEIHVKRNKIYEATVFRHWTADNMDYEF